MILEGGGGTGILTGVGVVVEALGLALGGGVPEPEGGLRSIALGVGVGVADLWADLATDGGGVKVFLSVEERPVRLRSGPTLPGRLMTEDRISAGEVPAFRAADSTACALGFRVEHMARTILGVTSSKVTSPTYPKYPEPTGAKATGVSVGPIGSGVNVESCSEAGLLARYTTSAGSTESANTAFMLQGPMSVLFESTGWVVFGDKSQRPYVPFFQGKPNALKKALKLVGVAIAGNRHPATTVPPERVYSTTLERTLDDAGFARPWSATITLWMRGKQASLARASGVSKA